MSSIKLMDAELSREALEAPHAISLSDILMKGSHIPSNGLLRYRTLIPLRSYSDDEAEIVPEV